MKNEKIGIWGQFGDGGPIADGQAVRTTIITNEMKNRYGAEKLVVLNTNNWKKHPFSFLIGTVNLLVKCKKVVIFPADNGFKTVVPIYHVLNIFFRRALYDVVIGGYLPNLLKTKPRYLKMLKKYKALFVQTPNLKKDLTELGLDRVYILSNLKRLNTVRRDEVKDMTAREVRVFTMSRINEAKGIDDAFTAVKKANETLGETCIRLTLFGMVAPEYQAHFDALLAENKDFADYGGVLKYDETADTLRDFFLMLFPTYYYGEGFPGNVIDAYHSAVPIIATDWNYNGDIIHDGRNGVLVPIHNPDRICEVLLDFYRDRAKRTAFALNNLTEAEQYQPDNVLQTFYGFMENETP